MTEQPDPGLSKARAAEALTPVTGAVHRWILTEFAGTGRAPLRADVAREARRQGADADATLDELAGRDVVALDECGEIRAAYPFSPVPTRHQVAWDGGPTAFAMCAVDALGMSAMLGVPVTITSAEPGTERAVTVQVAHDTARWAPHAAVVFAGQTGAVRCPAADRTCCHINFFTSAAAANDWAAGNPGVTGVVLDQDQALAAGIAEFGALLDGLTE